MKVLVFTTLFPNNIWPNSGVFVKERMSAVARLKGYDVRVVAPVPYYPPVHFGWRRGYSQVAREELIGGMKVYHPRYLMIPKIGMVLHGLMMFLSVVRFIKNLQSEFDFDIVDAHYVYPDGFAAVLIGAILKKPVVVSARGSDINLFAEFPIIRSMLRYTINHSNHSIAVCQALKDEMKCLGIDSTKISVVSNGVDTKKFFPCQRQQARELLGLPDKRRILLSVGILEPRKGFDFLIRAVKILIDESRLSELILVIIGNGPARGDLEFLVRSLDLTRYVRFVGEVPHETLRYWYSAADLFCLASDREGWPNVILESLACGTPVVGTDVWGIPEIIRSDMIGLLTKRDDNSIADALQKTLSKSWCRRTIVDFAVQHTWTGAAESLQRIFESVLESRPPSH